MNKYQYTINYIALLAICHIFLSAPQLSWADEGQPSLEDAVTAYLDHVESYGEKPIGPSPKYGPIWKTYGTKEAEAETIKQVIDRNNAHTDCVALSMFRGSEQFSDELNGIAGRGLRSDLPKLRSISSDWVARYKDKFTDEQINHARSAAIGSFVDSDGEHGFSAVSVLASPEDHRIIRKVYNKVFAKQTHDGQNESYQCGRYFFYHHGPTRARVLALLARLGDRPAIKEITDAILQEEDVQMRLWGWYMVEQVGDVSLLRRLSKQLEEALGDVRIGNEPIDRDIDPEAKGPRLKANLYVRICDIAVRAVYACDPEHEKWEFKIPQWMPGYIGPWHSVHGQSLKSYAHQEAVSPKVHNEEKHVFERDWVVGFTEEQIEHARNIAKKITAPEPAQN